MAKTQTKGSETGDTEERIARPRATETAAGRFVGAMWASGRPWHGISPRGNQGSLGAARRGPRRSLGAVCFGHAGALEQVTLAPPFVGRPYPPRDGGAPRVLSREPRAQRPRRRGARAEREARRECVGVAEHRGGYAGEVGGHLGEGEGVVGMKGI